MSYHFHDTHNKFQALPKIKKDLPEVYLNYTLYKIQIPKNFFPNIFQRKD